jgi:hypothetical protein
MLPSTVINLSAFGNRIAFDEIETRSVPSNITTEISFHGFPI